MMMDDRLQAYLDDELRRDELPPELREAAERWDVFLDDLRSTTPGEAPAWLEERVMEALPERPEAPWWREAADWLLRPRTVRVSPLAGLAAAAALALMVAVPLSLTGPGDGVETADGGPGAAGVGTPVASGPSPERDRGTVYVEFRLRAPEARSVAVAGDFTDWEPVYYLSDADGDGVWAGRIPLGPGMHEYMFVVDGERWMTDPGAERYVDDGFGNRNALVAIPARS